MAGFNLKKIGRLAAAFGAGAAVGAGAQYAIQKIPMIGTIPILPLGIGFLAAREAGSRMGGKNAAMAGIIGFIVGTGALSALNLGGIIGSVTTATSTNGGF
jgi:hypothetical protein